jgi:hypothetical protein
MRRRLMARFGVWWDAIGSRLFTRSLAATPTVGDRAYYIWRWNGPLGDDPPLMVLEVDDLPLGRKYQAKLSPAQAATLCRYGLDAVEQQMSLFGDTEPREYDVRKAW